MAPIILTEKDKIRFFSKLKRNEATGCLEWTGTVRPGGYGRFNLGRGPGRGTRLAHRVAFALAGGVLTPQKPHVLHNCPGGDNPLCCEPAHLRAGDNADNSLDMAAKGRGRAGQFPYGASRMPRGRFMAAIRLGGRRYYLGIFDTAQEASAVATTEKERLLREHVDRFHARHTT